MTKYNAQEVVVMLEKCIEDCMCEECRYHQDPRCIDRLMRDAKNCIEEQHKKLVTYSVRGVR